MLRVNEWVVGVGEHPMKSRNAFQLQCLLFETSASLVVTSALLVLTRKLLGTSASNSSNQVSSCFGWPSPGKLEGDERWVAQGRRTGAEWLVRRDVESDSADILKVGDCG